MKAWRHLLVVPVAALLTLVQLGVLAQPAAPATSGISVTFVGATPVASEGFCCGQTLLTWGFPTIAVGTSPLAVDTLNISFGEGFGYSASFTLNDLHGDTLQGFAGSGSSTSMSGSASSGTGTYAALVGHPFTLHFDVTPATVPTGFPGEILPLPTNNTTIVAPAGIVGTLTVAP